MKIFLALVLCAVSLLHSDEIRIEVLHGMDIAPYAGQILAVCRQVYQEYPYLYVSDEADDDYFTSFMELHDAMVSLAFDGEKVIGFATGIPIKKAQQDLARVFEDAQHDLVGLYYLGEFVLLPEYRKRGISSELYRQFEGAAREMKRYSSISLCQIEQVNSEKPADYVPNDGLWRKFGFMHHPELSCSYLWVNVGQTAPSPHLLVFWIKSLE